MLPEIITGIAVAVVIGIGTWLIRVMLKSLKTYMADEIRSKLVPNGGSSIADRMSALEGRMDEIAQIFKDAGCPNPGCPQRYACAHMPTDPPKRSRRGLFG